MADGKSANGKAEGMKADKPSVVPNGANKTKADASKDITQDKVVSYFSLYRGIDSNDYLAISLGLLGSFVNGLTFPAFSFVFAQLIDSFDNPAKLLEEVEGVTIWFSILAGITLVSSFFEVGMFMYTGARQAARLRQRYLEKALHQDISYYDTTLTSGGVQAGLNEDCTAIQNALSEKVGNTVHHLVTFLASLAIAFWRGWKLTLVMVALLPLIAVAGGILAKVLTWGTTRRAQAFEEANIVAAQSIANIRTVASFQAEQPIYQRFADMLDRPRRISAKLSLYNGMAGGSINAVVFLTYGVAFLYGAKLVREEGYSAGQVMNVIFAAIIGGFSLGQAGPNFGTFATGRTAGYRVFSVIDRKPAIDLADKGIVPTKDMQGEIRITGVSFAYPARPDVTVFADLNLSISAGQTAALVGASGSGKSTIIQLLQRFYDPASGSICVDGTDIRELSLEWYRDNVGLVSQEPTLFATSIKENIAMGRPGATDAEIEEAAKLANAMRFIQKLPEKVDTQVGERGVQLSGGQKQRIAIARALLKNPRLLLLDEATSALDTVSERLVQAALERLAQGRTSVIVAHRLSTIRNADKIAVMQAGGVVEEGTHSALYSSETSVYHSLVRLQEQATDRREEMAREMDLEAAVVADEAAAEAAAAMARESSRVPENGAVTTSARQTSARASASLDVPRGSAALAPRKSLEQVASKPGEVMSAKELVEKAEDAKADELTEEEKAVKVGFGRLLGMNRGEWPYLAVGTLASAAVGTVMPLFAIILSDLINGLTDVTTPPSEILRYAFFFWGLGIGNFICMTIQGGMFGLVGSNLSERVRRLFFHAVLYMEVAWFDRDVNTSGNLTSRLAADAPTVRGAVGDALGIVVQNVVTLVTGYVIAFVSGWKMTLVITAVLPLLGFSSYMQIKFFTGLDNKGGELFGQANQTANEAVQALRTVHSYNLQARIAALYRSLLELPHRKSVSNAIFSGAAFGVSQAMMFGVYALGFWYGGTLVDDGEMSFEEMLKVFFSILLATMGISQAQIAFPDAAKGKTAVARVFRVIDRKSLIDASKPEGERPGGAVHGEVALQNVDFAYPLRPDVPVFRNFSLVAPAGHMTALVGESGSGKSTIVNLVERFYDVDAGAVMLDGANIKSLDITWLRAQVGLVSQEPALFNGTIMENVQLGKPGATPDEVRDACEVANACEFIERQPDKYGTLLGEGGGISLSGGQKQRIAIARAVLKDPRVLLLDEATSALDAESERVVQAALDRLMAGRTSIVIAHRLTTVRQAHKIAVVQRGVVLEEGTHDELMARGNDGAYVQLARAQAGM